MPDKPSTHTTKPPVFSLDFSLDLYGLFICTILWYHIFDWRKNMSDERPEQQLRPEQLPEILDRDYPHTRLVEGMIAYPPSQWDEVLKDRIPEVEEEVKGIAGEQWEMISLAPAVLAAAPFRVVPTHTRFSAKEATGIVRKLFLLGFDIGKLEKVPFIARGVYYAIEAGGIVRVPSEGSEPIMKWVHGLMYAGAGLREGTNASVGQSQSPLEPMQGPSKVPDIFRKAFK